MCTTKAADTGPDCAIFCMPLNWTQSCASKRLLLLSVAVAPLHLLCSPLLLAAAPSTHPRSLVHSCVSTRLLLLWLCIPLALPNTLRHRSSFAHRFCLPLPSSLQLIAELCTNTLAAPINGHLRQFTSCTHRCCLLLPSSSQLGAELRTNSLLLEYVLQKLPRYVLACCAAVSYPYMVHMPSVYEELLQAQDSSNKSCAIQCVSDGPALAVVPDSSIDFDFDLPCVSEDWPDASLWAS